MENEKQYELWKHPQIERVKLLNTHGGQMYNNERNSLVLEGYKKVGTINTILTIAELDNGLAYRTKTAAERDRGKQND